MKTLHAELDRRRLLRYLGNAALALPFTRVLLEERLFGATPAKRALLFYFPDGIIKERWHPTSTGKDFKFQPMTAPLEKVRDDVILLKNVNYATEGSHEGGAAYILSGVRGFNGGISLDTWLGEKFKANVALPVVRLGVGANFQTGSHISYFAPGSASPIEDNPAKAFYNIFGGAAGPVDPVAKNKLLAAEMSILDLCMNDIKGLQTKLGSVEKQKLDVHLESLRELERRVQNAASGPVTAACTKEVDMRGLSFPQPDYNYPPEPHKNEHFGVIGDIMTDLAVQVLACGVSNVLYFQWSHPVSPTSFNFPGGTDQPRGHHDMSHYGDLNGSMAMDFVKAQAWYMDRLAKLLLRLKEIKEGDQSLLYHTAAMALTEIADSNLHDFKNVGLVLAGQAGGAWSTGRCVDGQGASHNQVLVAMLQAMGLPDMTFGDPALGRGPLPGLAG
jgi:hypothetical protein